MNESTKILEKNNEKNNNLNPASTWKMMSYSFTFFIASFMIASYGVAVIYFYEVEVGLPIFLVAIANAIYAIWNMFNDPLVGYLTDKPFKWSKKWGIRFPWIIISVIPSIICLFLIFTPPDVDVAANPWPIFWYMVIITCLYDGFFSLYQEHYSGGFANQFRSDLERRKAGTWTQVIGILGTLSVSLTLPFFIEYGNKSSFAKAALIGTIIMSVAVVLFIPGIRESKEAKERYLSGYQNEQNKVSFLKLMNIALRRKNFMLSLCAYLLFSLSYVLYYASIFYFIKDILRLDPSVAFYTSAASLVGSFISMPLWAKFAKKFGNSTTYALGLLLIGINYIPSLWMTTLTEAIIFSITGGIANSCFGIMVMPIVSDCYDEVTLVMKRHQEATLLGIRNFFFRVTLIFQGFIIAWVHVATGYNRDPFVEQTALAIWGIRVHMALIPAILLFCASFIIFKWYDLKGEKLQAVKGKLHELGL
ncbi:MAG: MFS transporter [Promethearchaeota archaeon]